MVAMDADQKKKLYILLGLAGLLGIGGILAWQPWNQGAGDTGDTAVAPPGADVPPGAGTTPATAPATGGAPAPAAPATTTAAAGDPMAAPMVRNAQLTVPSSGRVDPFTQEWIVPTPTPYIYIPPTPTPQAPVRVPPPPREEALNLPGIRGPGGSSFSGGLLSRSPLLVELPPIRINRMNNQASVPSDLPPRLPTQGGLAAIPPSPNKRISGVVIGDTVRALIEISDGEEIVTRVVQPGDEIEGIRILRIERVREGDRLVTRMIIREQNEERRVDLRPSPNPLGGGGEGGGYPGAGGGSYPGAGGGGYPGSGRGGGGYPGAGGGGYPGGRTPGGGGRPPRPPSF